MRSEHFDLDLSVLFDSRVELPRALSLKLLHLRRVNVHRDIVRQFPRNAHTDTEVGVVQYSRLDFITADSYVFKLKHILLIFNNRQGDVVVGAEEVGVETAAVDIGHLRRLEGLRAAIKQRALTHTRIVGTTKEYQKTRK